MRRYIDGSARMLFAGRGGRRLLATALASLAAAALALLWWRRAVRYGEGVSDFDHDPLQAGERLVPLAPDGLWRRLQMVRRLYCVPDFLHSAWSPATATRHAEQSVAEILQQLDRAPRSAPGPLARSLARYTSFLKHVGIMGWADLGCHVAVEGWIDDHDPVESSDGMLTIDLRIVRLWIDGEEVTDRLAGPRYLRAEVFCPVVRLLSRRPRLNDCLRVEGALRIDHDGLDFYELHVSARDCVQMLDCETLSFSREPGPREPTLQRLLLKIWPFD